MPTLAGGHFKMTYKKFIFAVVLALVGVGAFAQALPVGVSPVFAPTVTPTGFSYAAGSASSANAASLAFANPANGAVYAQATQRVALSSGATADFVIRSSPSAANIAGALGRFAGKTLPLLATGVALYDLGKELGFEFVNTTGTFEVKKPPITAGGCGGIPAAKVPSTTSGCFGNYGGLYFIITSVVNTGSQCNIYATCSNGGWPNTYLSNYPLTGVTDTSTPSTLQAFIDAAAAKSTWPSTSAINRALTDAVASGEVIPLPIPNSITGPASIALPPTVVTNPDGSKVTTTPTINLTYAAPNVTINNSTTAVTTNSSNVVTGTTTTAAPTEVPKTCGYPGGPPCKLDETGTPDKAADKVYNPQADAVKSAMDAGTATISGTGDKSGLFSGFSVLWSAPAVVACTPYVLPAFKGVSMGSLDPCPVVDGVRLVMGYIWAFMGLMMCIGFVRESIQQG